MNGETESTLGSLDMDYLDVVSSPKSFATVVDAQEALKLRD